MGKRENTHTESTHQWGKDTHTSCLTRLSFTKVKTMLLPFDHLYVVTRMLQMIQASVFSLSDDVPSEASCSVEKNFFSFSAKQSGLTGILNV